jgi:septum formation protein
MASKVEERIPSVGDPCELVKRLAVKKARAVADRIDEGLVIAADTVVVLGRQIFGKPRDEKDAERMLSALSGAVHQVVTGLAIVDVDTRREVVDCERTQVRFRQLSRGEIRNYIATGEPLGKAGAYAVQGRGALLVEQIDGCFYNVVGLPLGKLREMLAEFGIHLL